MKIIMNIFKCMLRLFGEKPFLCGISTVVLMSSFISCTEEYDLQLEGEHKIVVDAKVTNEPGPYYVQLRLSKSQYDVIRIVYDYENETREWIQYEPIYDARVTISDDETGVIDTLTLAPDSILYWNEYTEQYEMYGSRYKGRDGFYCTSKITGVPGHTYRLNVEWKNKKCTSSCTMPNPVAIDSIKFHTEKGKDDDDLVPYLWFTDNPNEKNYYITSVFSDGATWGVCLLNDENIKSSIAGIDAFKGESVESWRRTFFFEDVLRLYGQEFQLASVTKEVYLFYSSLIKQIHYDGGVYTPAPAAPPTNIKGDVLGLFNVEYVDRRLVKTNVYQ